MDRHAKNTSYLGAFLGHAWAHLWPSAGGAAFAVAGAAAMLTAGLQAPAAAIAFVLELTDGSDRAMVAMLLAAVGSVLTCRRFEQRSVYSARLPLH